MQWGNRYRKTCKRYNTPWHAHFLSFSCYRQRALLSRDRTRRYFLTAVATAREKHRFDLWGYVVMPEHVHLLIFPRNEVYSISVILKSIKQSVSRKAVHYLRTCNPGGLKALATGQRSCPYRFWQAGGGYDRNIWSSEEAHEKLTYIHENPVRRGLVTGLEDWPWSSWHAWEKGIDDPLPVDRKSFPLLVK